MLRNCPEAPATIAWVSNGKFRRINGWLAVAEFVASAPIETPPDDSLISLRFRRLRSTSSFGRSTSSFIKSMMLVPPARNFARGFAATTRAASAAFVARTYLNGLIGPLLSDPRQLFLAHEAPGARGLSARVGLPDRRDDARVSAAAANVAAHSLAYLVVGKLCERRGHVLRNVADISAPGLLE